MKSILYSDSSKNIIVILILLLCWHLVSLSSWAESADNNLWFSNVFEVYTAIKDILSNKSIHILTSFKLILIATSIVILVGVIFGIVIGFFEKIYRSISWSIDFWRSIPPVVVIFIFYNLDDKNELYWRIWLSIFGTLPIMIMQIADSILNAPKTRMLIFNSLNVGVLFRIKTIIIYEILPSLFSITRTIISFSIIIIIVSEMVISSDYGIGREIIFYKGAYEINYVYAYAIIIGTIGFILNKIIRLLEKIIIHW